MFRMLPLLLVAGCLGGTFDVDVTWQTQGRSTTIPAEEVGAHIYYFGTNHGFGTAEWFPGYDSAARIHGESQSDTTEICVALERQFFVVEEQFGHDVLVERYTALSEQVCQDVDLDDDAPHADFALVLGL